MPATTRGAGWKSVFPGHHNLKASIRINISDEVKNEELDTVFSNFSFLFFDLC